MTVIAGPPQRVTGERYQDHALTTERAGRVYDVGTLVTYQDGTPAIVFPHHNVTRLAVTRRAWSHVLDACGYSMDLEERYQATRGYATDHRGGEW